MRHDDGWISASAHLHRKQKKSTNSFNDVIIIIIITLAYVNIAARYTLARAGATDGNPATLKGETSRDTTLSSCGAEREARVQYGIEKD